eukprot:Colp12_sorted_trinity150504_noHs@31008
MSCPMSGARDPTADADGMSGCPMAINGPANPAHLTGSDGIHYGEYLELDKLLTCQHPESLKQTGKAHHDELLFIITHQAHELWFKQILHEIDSIITIMQEAPLQERKMLVVSSRLNRILEIQKILIQQIRVLETMTPHDFMDFRSFLSPASGFQSLQFRVIENKLGLKHDLRTAYQRKNYWEHFSNVEAEILKDVEEKPSVLHVVEKWLERTPGLETDGFDFFSRYRAAVNKMLEDRRAEIAAGQYTEEVRQTLLAECEKNEQSFDSLFDSEKHDKLVSKGDRRLSHRALQGALLIFLYRDEPLLHLPFIILSALMDIDAMFTQWRYHHMMMVQRMIGNKMGTGGSSGYIYLRSTVSDRYKVFLDLFNLSTYFIPRALLPELDEETKRRMGYNLNRIVYGYRPSGGHPTSF